MPGVALVTDSTASLPRAVADARGIQVVPLHVVADGRERDETELLAVPEDDLVRWLGQVRKAGTSRPSPEVFLRAYERAAEAGHTAVVSAHLSGRLSGTVDAARLAAARSPVPVEVVDTEQVAMAIGYAVLTGADVAHAGGTLQEVAHRVRARAAAATVTFYVDTLDHLRRGGRMGAAQHLLATALSIKPILGVAGGAVVPRARVRTAPKAIDRLVELSVAAVGAAPSGADVAVHAVGAGDRAQEVLGRLREACPEATVCARRLGPVLAVHVGPGTVAVVVSPRPAAGTATP